MKRTQKPVTPPWQAQRAESLLDGDNSAYLEHLYEKFLDNANAVPAAWKEYFSALPKVNGHTSETAHSEVRNYFRGYTATQPNGDRVQNIDRISFEHDQKQVRVLQLINAYRILGHRQADVNPLSKPTGFLDELSLEHHQLSEDDLALRFNTGSLAAPDEATLESILQQLRNTYCGSIGAEYMHISNTEYKRWIQQRLESLQFRPEYSRSQRRYILDRLTAAEILERFLHSKYVGQKRFSLEGAESLIPLLDDLIQNAGSNGIKEIVIGMAHRGRLNTLVNILGKSPALLFKEFEGDAPGHHRTGDVKYHLGFSSNMNTPAGPIHVALAFNPSHLEIVSPVVEGAVRARQDRWREDPGDRALSVLIHGDAAFAGQGVVMEMLNMSNTRGFKTRGTVHIVINNQIGFTTSTQHDARSTLYCTDVAKMVNAPIFHVNGDDPEAVIYATQIALDYRMRFHRNVVIDLVCYRRHGHNEADEPAVTQPQMYAKIRQLPTTRERYAKTLVSDGIVSRDKAEEMIQVSRRRLESGEPVVPHLLDDAEVDTPFPVNWKRYNDGAWYSSTDTAISKEHFVTLAQGIAFVPEGFKLHPRVDRIVNARRQMAIEEHPLDWGFCELLAYASLVEEGYPVRLSGQDSSRGTFFHRHSVLHDQENGHQFVPLKNISRKQAPFTVIDSILSEEAVLAFEYGYATTEPDVLTIWEAQFGDFANGAQVVIDQFISSGEQKWGRLSGLVMFLPHGYEGQGPEHSSARLERYLQLCAQYNIQVCAPTTPAQVFHMLRRQIHRRYRKPLIVMTPKSLLRHPLAVSDLRDITHGAFKPIMGEVDKLDPNHITRIILCNGKVYYDLLERRRSQELKHVAIIRIEQLYPFPEALLCQTLKPYKNIQQYVWCQEEPLNQGAWYNQQHHLHNALGRKMPIQHVTRPASASPAVGNLKIHREQQQQIVDEALGLKEPL